MTISTQIPSWNQEDLRLINRGLANAQDCSSPDDARVFIGNRLLAELERIRAGQLQLSGLAKLKRRAKHILLAKQLFGLGCAVWNAVKLRTECEHILGQWAFERGQQRSVSIDSKEFQSLLKSNPLQWEPVLHLSQELRSNGAILILQGSYGDDTTTAFSDIDFVLFGDLESPNHVRLKEQLDKVVLKADPLQHHGVFFYPDPVRSRYSESILPLDTFQNSTTICSPVDLDFLVLNDRYSPAATLKSFVNVVRSFLQGNLKVRGMWDWKFKISQFLLIPALLAATRGDYLYKGDSFSAMAPLYSDCAWSTINDLTYVRNVWDVSSQDSDSAEYLDDTDRILGRIKQDHWEVPDKLSLWKQPNFSDNASRFLTETLTLAGLG